MIDPVDLVAEAICRIPIDYAQSMLFDDRLWACAEYAHRIVESMARSL